MKQSLLKLIGALLFVSFALVACNLPQSGGHPVIEATNTPFQPALETATPMLITPTPGLVDSSGSKGVWYRNGGDSMKAHWSAQGISTIITLEWAKTCSNPTVPLGSQISNLTVTKDGDTVTVTMMGTKASFEYGDVSCIIITSNEGGQEIQISK